MEELLELRSLLEHENYAEALTLVGEMEEMSKDEKTNKIFSYAEILVLHLIKRQAENRTTRSWEASIRSAAYKIQYINKRRKSGGVYISEAELKQILDDVWPVALLRASLEAFEGQFDEKDLSERVDLDHLKSEALTLIRSFSVQAEM